MRQLEDGTWVDPEIGEILGPPKLKRCSSGAWVIPDTCQIITWPLPRRLQSVVDAALGACCSLGTSHAEAVNLSLHKRAERKLAELQTEHDQVVARIDHGWGWLDRHPDHETFDARERHVLTWIKQYEQLDSTICAAMRRLT